MKSAKLALAAAVAAGGLTLATGLAVANGGFPGLDSHANDDATEHIASLTTATAGNDGFEADDQTTSDTPKSVEFESDDHETSATSNTVDSEDETTGTDRPQNHGWYVSQVAQTSGTVGAQSTGGNHGEAVSTEAQSQDGKTGGTTVDHTSDTSSQESTTGTVNEDHSGSHDGGHGAGD
jgi:hypothetical protein